MSIEKEKSLQTLYEVISDMANFNEEVTEKLRNDEEMKAAQVETLITQAKELFVQQLDHIQSLTIDNVDSELKTFTDNQQLSLKEQSKW